MSLLRRPVLWGLVVTLTGLGVLLVPRGVAPLPALAGNVLPPRPAPTFLLRDQFGHGVSLSQFRGRPVVLTFMQAHCTGLCPLVTETVRRTLAELGPAGKHVAVLAISNDPEGDTRSAVIRYSRQHHMLHRWHYLMGSRHQLQPVWRRYYIYVAPPHAPAKLKGGHTSAVYLLDRNGRERVVALGDPDSTELLNNLRVLLGIGARDAPSDTVPAPQVGHPAPELSLRTLQGAKVQLKNLHRPVLLNFWATWCTACKAEIPTLSTWYSKHHRDLLVLGIDEQEPHDSVAAYARKLRIPYPVALDGSGAIGARYDVSGLPMSLFIDSHGTVRSVRFGAMTNSDLLNLGPAR